MSDWYHLSPSRIEVGELLVPSGGPSSFRAWHNKHMQDGEGVYKDWVRYWDSNENRWVNEWDRELWVWIDRLDDVLWWSKHHTNKSDTLYVYRVEPLDDPMERHGETEGYTVTGAIVTELAETIRR